MKEQIKVLIVEDDPNICDLIQLYMDKQGYNSNIALDGEVGLAKFYDEKPDFVLLDIMLPEMNGWEVCKMIRLENKHIPIIMLTGKGESYDKIRGLELGADDYIVKPFDPNELVARMKAVLRRSSRKEERKENIKLGSIFIDVNQFKVFLRDTEVSLPKKELELIYFLASNPNQVFTRQQLLDRIWGDSFEGDSRTVDVHIKRLREKLKEKNLLIQTIRGIGYKLEIGEK
ncbi:MULTISPECIES: response regulator transcription factor [Bacillus]|uniref:response regulator transcription factor n=1 Tax=Bacillus TaxID=1386 RepID=UPI000BB85300|nr:response regulator transcription factor [Bacillus sp. FJAT-45066]